MTSFALPVSFFKSISMTFGGAGLIFEGLRQSGECRNEGILLGLTRRKPSKIKPEDAPEEFFLGDTLSERARERIGTRVPDLPVSGGAKGDQGYGGTSPDIRNYPLSL
jgi:hypothetical protein